MGSSKKVKQGTTIIGDISMSRRQKRADNQGKVFSVFTYQREASIRVIASKTGLSGHTITQQLRVLSALGKVYRVTKGVYALTSANGAY